MVRNNLSAITIANKVLNDMSLKLSAADIVSGSLIQISDLTGYQEYQISDIRKAKLLISGSKPKIGQPGGRHVEK